MNPVLQSDQRTEGGALADETWTLLRTLFGHHKRRFLIAASQLDLHPAQAGTLLQLGSPLPMREIAQNLGCDNSNVTGLVDRLESRGLVTREASPDDRRVKHVVLTSAGRRIRDQLLAHTGELRQGLDALSAAEQRQLRDLLGRVLEHTPTA